MAAKEPVSTLPAIELKVPEGHPRFERGIVTEPTFIYEERQDCGELSGYNQNVQGWLTAMVDRGFANMGKDFDRLPNFAKGNKVCLRIWIEKA